MADGSDLTPDEHGLIEQIADEFERNWHPEIQIADFLERVPPKLQPPLRRMLEEFDRQKRSPHPTGDSTPEETGPPAEELPPVGATLGKFALEAVLGNGGFGCVYRALDRERQDHVALKLLRPELWRTAKYREGFLREAQRATSLNHEHIVHVHEVGDLEGYLYIAYHLIDGVNLARRLTQHHPTPAQAVELLLPVLDAVWAAHRAGLVHRDLKPENILVDRSGKPYVTDFGMAATDWDMICGREVGVAGTPPYMAPEQLADEPHRIGERTDIFALGLILYEMLTGQRPWPFEWRKNLSPPEAWNQLLAYGKLVTERMPKSPRTHNPAVPADLADVCLKAITRNPDQRYMDCSAFAEALRRAVPVSAESGSRQMVLVFSSVVDSVGLKTKLGNVVYSRLLSRHDALFKQIMAMSASAEILKDTGDGFLARFPTSSGAVAACLRLQCAIKTEPWGPEQIQVRMGIHSGEMAELEKEATGQPKIVGLAADMAARIMGLAQPGQILMTRAVFDDARMYIREHPSTSSPLATSAGTGVGGEGAAPSPLELRWLRHGPYLLQGLDEPVEVCEVGTVGIAPLREPPDSDTARRAVAPGDDITLGAEGGWTPGQGLIVPHRENWVLQQRLGEGGFGEVWLAEHEKTKEKRVFKFCLQSDRLRGLKREAILFRLLKESLGDRPDIARVIDWQFESPPFFLESEYTPEGSLPDWAEGQGGIAALPLTTRLELVAQAAEALGAAHSLGVIHKDIKPSNILIRTDRPAKLLNCSATSEVSTSSDRGGRPRAVLCDFGIGLITDLELLRKKAISEVAVSQLFASVESSRTGTRLYQAPELAEGKTPTTLSDIYSLGVTLYQVVVGDFGRALATGWEREVADELLREDIARCVDGRPERRLESAAQLTRRLRTLDRRRAEVTTHRIGRIGLIVFWAVAAGPLFAFASSLLWSPALNPQNSRKAASIGQSLAFATEQAAADGLVALALFVWPIFISSLLYFFRSPQLLRPTAVTLLGLVIGHLLELGMSTCVMIFVVAGVGPLIDGRGFLMLLFLIPFKLTLLAIYCHLNRMCRRGTRNSVTVGSQGDMSRLVRGLKVTTIVSVLFVLLTTAFWMLIGVGVLTSLIEAMDRARERAQDLLHGPITRFGYSKSRNHELAAGAVAFILGPVAMFFVIWSLIRIRTIYSTVQSRH